MKLVGELFGQFVGPVLVIGGGPSASGDLAALRELGVEPRAVLSANEHGHKQSIYPITHSVCCDATHGERRISMEQLLRPYGKPILSPCHFGDYRMPEWSLASNTGLSSIALAVFMGGAPVIVTGIDFYRIYDRNAPTYFYDAAAVSNSNVKNAENFERQTKALEGWISRHPPVRALRGALAERWGTFDPVEQVAPRLDLPQAEYRRKLPTLILQAHPSRPVNFKLKRVEGGRLFPASPNEARGPLRSGHVKLIETLPAPGETTVNLPADLVRPPRGYRPNLR